MWVTIVIVVVLVWDTLDAPTRIPWREEQMRSGGGTLKDQVFPRGTLHSFLWIAVLTIRDSSKYGDIGRTARRQKGANIGAGNIGELRQF